MKAQFLDHLENYVSYRLKSRFDSLNKKQQSSWMARFYADEIVRPFNPQLIPDSDEDLDACLIDGADDCGVDFFARCGNVVLIIQAKYSGSRKSGKRRTEDPVDFESFRNVLTRLYRSPEKLKMNSKLKEAIVDIDWDKDDFDLRYITLLKSAENSTRRANDGVEMIPQLHDLADRCSLVLEDEEELNIQLRDSMSLAHGAPLNGAIVSRRRGGAGVFSGAGGEMAEIGLLPLARVALEVASAVLPH